MKLSSAPWNYCIVNASVWLASSMCSQVCQQEHVTQKQLTRINIKMEGHWNSFSNQDDTLMQNIEKPIHPNLFFKVLGFAEWNGLTLLKRQQMLAPLPNAREEKDSFK